MKELPRRSPLPVLGWLEWVRFTGTKLPAIKAKIDTGAHSSALHASQIELFERAGRRFCRFRLHPSQERPERSVPCEAPCVDVLSVKSSSGQSQTRHVVLLEVKLRGQVFSIEVTLSERARMRYRMLLGRSALRGRFLVDAKRSYMGGRRRDKPSGDGPHTLRAVPRPPES